MRIVKTVTIAAIILLVITVISVNPAKADDSNSMVEWINNERKWNQNSTIVIDPQLQSQAMDNALRMARTQQFVHSPMGEMNWFVDPYHNGWKNFGENIGRTTGTLRDLHLAFVRSPGHLNNILDSRNKGVGVAIVTDGNGVKWVSIEFGGF